MTRGRVEGRDDDTGEDTDARSVWTGRLERRHYPDKMSSRPVMSVVTRVHR